MAYIAEGPRHLRTEVDIAEGTPEEKKSSKRPIEDDHLLQSTVQYVSEHYASPFELTYTAPSGSLRAIDSLLGSAWSSSAPDHGPHSL